VARVKKKPFPRNPRKTSKSKGAFPNPLHPKTGPSIQKIIATLLKTGGMKTRAAKILACDVGTITNRMKEFPEVAVAIEEAQESRLDEAETMLDRNIAKGEQRAIEFFLSKKGRGRGYGTDSKDDEPDLQTVVELFQRSLEEAKTEFPMQPVVEVAPDVGAAKPQRPRVGTRLE